MNEKYYLTTNDGFTYEEMSLYELGRRLLTYDGAEYRVHCEYYLVHKDSDGGYQTVEATEALAIYEVEPDHEEESGLVLRFAQEFVEFGNRKGWLNIPDSVRAYNERRYKEELQSIKENSDA